MYDEKVFIGETSGSGLEVIGEGFGELLGMFVDEGKDEVGPPEGDTLGVFVDEGLDVVGPPVGDTLGSGGGIPGVGP